LPYYAGLILGASMLVVNARWLPRAASQAAESLPPVRSADKESEVSHAVVD